MGWHGHLELTYRRDGDRCIAHDRHHGPLRVLRALAERVEPAMKLLERVWTHWRRAAWDRAACPPRVWRT